MPKITAARSGLVTTKIRAAFSQVESCLDLIDVICDAGQKGRCPDSLCFAVGNGLDMIEEFMPHCGSQPYSRLCGKILCGNGEQHPDQAQCSHNDGIAYDDILISSRNSDIDDVSDHKRDQQFKRSLEQLEQRPEDSFFPILFQKREYFFQIKPCFQSDKCC